MRHIYMVSEPRLIKSHVFIPDISLLLPLFRLVYNLEGKKNYIYATSLGLRRRK